MRHVLPFACLLPLLLAPAPTAWAQSSPAVAPAARGTLRLQGRVLDAHTSQPVPFATVALLPAGGGPALDGALCNEQGQFSLARLAAGRYELHVSFLGYGRQVRPVALTAGQPELDLGVISLQPEVRQLSEVTVTGERPVVEAQPDRLVYNAAQDATNRGGTAADVLRKAPMVSVDPDGNLQLRGAANVQVLINGKPTAVAGGVGDLLRQLPADQIKAVEVITAPSARYEGEGSAGIVNIVLTKATLRGLSGTVGAAAGTRIGNLNVGLNLRRERLTLTTALNGQGFWIPGRQHVDRTDQLPNGGWGRLTQRNTGRSDGGLGSGRLSLDYDPAPHHALNLTWQGSTFQNRLLTDADTRYQASNPDLEQAFLRSFVDRGRRLSYDLTGSYVRTYPNSRREWTVLAQHARTQTRRRYDVEQFAAEPGAGRPYYEEEGGNLARNVENTLQTDYVQPLGEQQTVELGAKLILREVHSDYQAGVFEQASGRFVPQAALTGAFDYAQRVLAGYATWATPLGKRYNLRLGGRLEHTDVAGRFQDRPDRVRDAYFNALPNVALTRNLKKPGAAVRLSYSRRLQRPGLFYLNPFVNRLDPRNVQTGTPALAAEVTDQAELGWTTFVGASTINLSLYTRQTNNAIEGVRVTDAQGVTTLTYQNAARNRAVGLTAFGAVKPLPKWDLSGNVNVYYARLHSRSLGIANDGVAYTASLNSGYKFDRGLSLQFFGQLNSPRVLLQGRLSAFPFYALGLRKEVLKGKADLTLNADNFLRRRYRFVNDFETAQSVQTNHLFIYNRGARLAFSYRFGQLDHKQPRRPRRSLRNDDEKPAETTGQ
ncbi:TonB-dependent receptor domain-containing protein [Hymenobacter sp. B81]|uniref:TonB-dependent receptor domain-containing protein n=1 Tax=Hymenobacter sp. B81 TaxID=3344878 RepID=UPI0037DD85AE